MKFNSTKLDRTGRWIEFVTLYTDSVIWIASLGYEMSSYTVIQSWVINLRKRSFGGKQLDIYHAVQKHPMEQVIESNKHKVGLAITIPKLDHKRIPTIKWKYNRTARDLLAKDIR